MTRIGLALVTALALGACHGYDDLPLPLREQGTMTIERLERYAEGPGVTQLALALPTDAIGPFVVVGPPAVQAGDGSVVSWAFGPCRGSPTPTDTATRLCAAVSWSSDDPAVFTVVVESRGDARRFTLVGVEASE